MHYGELFIGCAGWSLPRSSWPAFPAAGTHLERYAARLPAVEINSSFYRPHRPDTYRRWAASTPPAFRFAVKMPRSITHEHRLQSAEALLTRFLGEAGELGDKLGVLLVQLPPTLAFGAARAEAFLRLLRQQHAGAVVWEPRHPSWFAPAVTELLTAFEVARVAADPAPAPAAAVPAGWPAVAYWRLHGSPRLYYSAYARDYLQRLAQALRSRCALGQSVWCILDNTAEGAAIEDALFLQRCLSGG